MFRDDEENPYLYPGSIAVPEVIVSKEELDASSGANSAVERKAAEIVEKRLNEPMSGWEVIAYLREFYPNLDPVFALKVMKIISESEKTEDSKTIIDIRIIKEELEKGSVNLGEKSLESLENCAIFDFMLRKAVPEILKDRPEDHLKILDVGGGPTIYQHIALMGIADSIIHSEFLESNREEIKNWQEGRSEFDWSSFFQTFQAYLKIHPEMLSGAMADIQERFKKMASEGEGDLENELKGKITQISRVDVFREDLGGEVNDKKCDVLNISKEGSIGLITSNFCIESATKDPDLWKRGIENVTAQVPRDGFLLMTAIRNADWYKVGDNRMDAVPINAEILSAELKKQGFEIRSMSELIGSEKEVVGYDGMVFVLAKRITI